MNIVFACGGTGGHVYPALALAAEFQSLGHACSVVGRKVGMENDLVGTSFPYIGIEAYPLKRGSIKENLTLPWRLFRSWQQAKKALQQTKADCVVGTGGYVSLPTLVAAKTLGIPVFLQEQNLHAGIANKIAARWAKQVYVAGQAAVQAFPAGLSKITGNPTRPIPPLGAAPHPFEPKMFNILVLGGSQGARGINQRIADVLPEWIKQEQIRLVWQCGKNETTKWQELQPDPKVQVQAFLNPVYPYMQHADLVITRAGASTISELLALGKPALFIPFPHAAEDHQTQNALALVEGGAALLERESEPNQLASKIQALMADPDRLKKMSESAAAMHVPNSTTQITSDILSRLESNS